VELQKITAKTPHRDMGKYLNSIKIQKTTYRLSFSGNNNNITGSLEEHWSRKCSKHC
jgi:hypothetical protein